MTDFFQHGVFATHDDEYLVEPFWAEENETTLDRQDFHIVYRRSAILRTSSHCGLTGQSLTHGHSLTRGHSMFHGCSITCGHSPTHGCPLTYDHSLTHGYSLTH